MFTVQKGKFIFWKNKKRTFKIIIKNNKWKYIWHSKQKQEKFYHINNQKSDDLQTKDSFKHLAAYETK